jgi:hypothetical protein
MQGNACVLCFYQDNYSTKSLWFSTGFQARYTHISMHSSAITRIPWNSTESTESTECFALRSLADRLVGARIVAICKLLLAGGGKLVGAIGGAREDCSRIRTGYPLQLEGAGMGGDDDAGQLGARRERKKAVKK